MPGAESPSVDELDRLIARAVTASPEGLTPARTRAALPRGLRPAIATVHDRLRSLAGRGVIHAWSARPERYGGRPLDEVVREQVLAQFEGTVAPRSAAEAARRVLAAGRSLVPAALPSLVHQGRLFQHPPRTGRTVLFGPRPADPIDYLGPDLERLVAKVARKGFAPHAVRQAIVTALSGKAQPPFTGSAAGADADADAAAILDAMALLNPQVRSGALVYLPHLRQVLLERIPQKPAFDRLILMLVARGRIEAQTHPVPSELKPAEREAMVDDGRGGVYMAVGLTRG